MNTKKLKFLTSTPLIAGVLVIIYVGLGMVYFQRQSQSQQLGSQVALMRNTMRKPEPDIAGLQAKLAAATAETDGMLNALPGPEQGIDVYGALLDMARKSNVEVLKIEMAPPVAPKPGTMGNVSLPYSLGVRGTREDIMDFVYRLAVGGDLLQGVEVRSLNIESSASGTENTAELDLYVHTWPDTAFPTPAPTQTSRSTK